MIQKIVHDPMLLARKSAPATLLDAAVAKDLLETLNANRDRCVGMAANMIGQLRRIIVFDGGTGARVLYNPEYLARTGPYRTEEGCLSLPGTRETTRYRTIRVRYQDGNFQNREETFQGFAAQIIQHEMDHLEGILI